VGKQSTFVDDDRMLVREALENIVGHIEIIEPMDRQHSAERIGTS